jgi:hypothetical protein
MVGAGARLPQIESSFYALVRPALDIEAPTTLYSAYDAVSHRQMLLTDDVAETRGATFGTAVDRRLTRTEAEQLVESLAGVHSPTSGGRRCGDCTENWLRSSSE